jgi:hypothetical protein
MIAKFRSWWKNTSKTLDAVIVTVLVVLLVLLVLIILGYLFNWPWTGLHGKTLYDWLQLLIIPAVLAVGGYLFNYTTGRTEREIASDRQREDALQAYIDKMSALLLENDLSKPVELEKVRKIGRVRTLTTLQRLDRRRKVSVLQFLYESGLIDKGTSIVDLSRADLSKTRLYKTNLSGADLHAAFLFGAYLDFVNLSGADLHAVILDAAILREANLSRADLREANLFGAILREADLSEADLTGARLTGANLSGAKVTDEQLDKAASLEGATMPDGTKRA